MASGFSAPARTAPVVDSGSTDATLATLSELGEEPYFDQLKLLVAGDRMDEAHVRGVAESVRRFVEGRGGRVRRVDVPKPGQHPHADLMGLLLLLMAAFGFFALALSGVLVVNLLTALLASQVRQIGVMKAVGGSDARIAGLYLAQALLLPGPAADLFLLARPLGGFHAQRLLLLTLEIAREHVQVLDQRGGLAQRRCRPRQRP